MKRSKWAPKDPEGSKSVKVQYKLTPYVSAKNWDAVVAELNRPNPKSSNAIVADLNGENARNKNESMPKQAYTFKGRGQVKCLDKANVDKKYDDREYDDKEWDGEEYNDEE